MNGTMRSNATPLHLVLVAMFFFDVGWPDPLPPAFLVVPPDAGAAEGADEEEGAAGPELEAALGALQFLQHLLFRSVGCQPNLHHGKQGSPILPGNSPGSFNSSLYQSKVSQQTSSAHLPSRFTLSHS